MAPERMPMQDFWSEIPTKLIKPLPTVERAVMAATAVTVLRRGPAVALVGRVVQW